IAPGFARPGNRRKLSQLELSGEGRRPDYRDDVRNRNVTPAVLYDAFSPSGVTCKTAAPMSRCVKHNTMGTEQFRSSGRMHQGSTRLSRDLLAQPLSTSHN